VRSHNIDTSSATLTYWHHFSQRVVNIPGNVTYSRFVINFPIFLPDFNQIWIFWTDFNESSQYNISRTSDQWGQCRWMQTEMMKLTDAFRDYANAPMKQWLTADRGWTSSFTVKSQYLTKFCGGIQKSCWF
jgi:hypothetical protein